MVRQGLGARVDPAAHALGTKTFWKPESKRESWLRVSHTSIFSRVELQDQPGKASVHDPHEG